MPHLLVRFALWVLCTVFRYAMRSKHKTAATSLVAAVKKPRDVFCFKQSV